MTMTGTSRKGGGARRVVAGSSKYGDEKRPREIEKGGQAVEPKNLKVLRGAKPHAQEERNMYPLQKKKASGRGGWG